MSNDKFKDAMIDLEKGYEKELDNHKERLSTIEYMVKTEGSVRKAILSQAIKIGNIRKSLSDGDLSKVNQLNTWSDLIDIENVLNEYANDLHIGDV